LFPSLNGLIDGLCPDLRLFPRRKVVYLAAIEPIPDANLDLIEAIENVELRQCKTVNAAGPHGLPNEHCIEPPAAASPSGNRPKFKPRSPSVFPIALSI
jgi:hypothetical protein